MTWPGLITGKALGVKRQHRSKPRSSRKPKARRGSSGAGRNKRVQGQARGSKKAKAALEPEQRRVRNRTILALSVLALVNTYVFVLNDDGLSGLQSLEAAAIGHRSGPLAPLGDPPASACSGDPVRIFDGLEDQIHLRGSLSGGYTLRLALLDLGVPGEEIDAVEAAIRDKVDLSLLGGSGAPLAIATDRDGGVQALEIELAEGHLLQACRNGEGFSVRNLQHPLRSDVEAIAIELGRDADLVAAVEAAGEKPDLARIIARSLSHDVDFMTEARPHDEIQVIVEKRWLGRRFHRYGAVLAIRFRGAEHRCAYYRFKPEGRDGGFFDSDGEPMPRELLRSPIGFFRVDPEARGLLPPSVEVVQGKLGATWRVPEGAPVMAIGSGVIRANERTAEEGNFVDLELADGTIVRYCHLGRVIGALEPGTRIEQGEVLGLAGHTGRTPHDRLRLELWVHEDGQMKTIDPLRRLGAGSERPPTVGQAVPEDQHARFRDDTAAQRRALRMAK